MPEAPITAARRRRVPPMAPEDRRAAIIAATLPLVAEHGTAVSTRQIAEAAGIAEGTIFRVFPDKPSLILATVLSALDPQPTLRALDAIDHTVDLRERILAAARILNRRISANARPLAALRQWAVDSAAGRGRDAAERDRVSTSGHPRESIETVLAVVRDARQRIADKLIDVIGADHDRLRCEPATAARLLFSTVLAAVGHHPLVDDPVDAETLVTILLDGLLLQPAADTADPPGPDAADQGGRRSTAYHPNPHDPEGRSC